MNLGRKIFPHTMRRNCNGEWILCGKSNNPIGVLHDYQLDSNKLPCRFPIKTLGEKKLLSLAYSPDAIQRNSKGDIVHVQLYELDADRLKPEYYEKLMILEKLQINQLK